MSFVDSKWNSASGEGEPSAYHAEHFSDDELTALALAADPEQALDADAVPLDLSGAPPWHSLPLWYMPPAMARPAGGWRVPIVASVVLALLLINALGLCITYGVLVAA